MDIDKYTKLVILANQNKDLNSITKEDLKEFIELDEVFETNIVDGKDIESLNNDEYNNIYMDWVSKATEKYEQMRNKNNKKTEHKRIALKINENKLYDDANYCEKDFNVEIYLLNFTKGTTERKGFLYDLMEKDIYNLKKCLENEYPIEVEIMWNAYTSEI